MLYRGNSPSESDASNDSLVLAQVIFRHGQRTIASPYANDPNKDISNWPEGFGQLTNEGKMQAYRLGQYFRRRYNNVIGRKYSSDDIFVQSTDYDRAIVSAQACLAGLYPPTEEEMWNPEIMWQPIPVHTIPEHIDYVLVSRTYFPEFTAALRKYMKESPELKRFSTEHADLLRKWAQLSGDDLRSPIEVTQLYDTIRVETDLQKEIPDWAREAIAPNGVLESIALFSFTLGVRTKELARLKVGTFIKEIFERCKQKVNSALKPDRPLWLYSAHDLQIINLLFSLGLFDGKQPPYAASLHFELYRTKTNDYYIQIFYRKPDEEHPTPMKIPGCGERCSLEQFYDLCKDLFPNDVKQDPNHATDVQDGVTIPAL